MEALVAPDTINAIPDGTLRAFANHGVIRGLIPLEEGDSRNVLAHFADGGVDIQGLAAQLQRESVAAWSSLFAAVPSGTVPPPPHSAGR